MNNENAEIGDPVNPNSEEHAPLGLGSAMFLVAASMIGAGVYTTSGFTLAALGSPGWVLAAWATGGVIAICGAICYGALARELTESGGEYLFLSRKLHPIAGLMAGWVSLLAGFTGAIAFAATTFETYLGWQDAMPKGAIATLVVVFAAILHTVGVRPGARVQDFVVILKFLLITAFVVIAVAMHSSASVDVPAETSVSEAVSWTAFSLTFATQLMYISLSFSGFNAAVYIAGEVNNASRNVPRAMLWGTCLVTLCYLLLNAVFVLAAPSEAIVGQPDVATKAAEAIAGETFASFVRVVILLGLFTSVSAMIMSGPRVYAKMAEDGFLPGWFRFSGRIAGKPPVAAIWAQATLGIIVIYASDLERLLSYLGFTLSVSAALTASLLFWVRGKSGARIRPLLYPITPIVFVGGTLLAATLSAVNSPVQAAVGLGTIAFGGLLYPWYAWRQMQRGGVTGE
ncbi:APC family permease [Novipirellula sp. SH528]|uniref:APC family permease n=1 Tax=Novipirellula sp. SH528 TaxID=3454466 RepID=UPI003F9ED838